MFTKLTKLIKNYGDLLLRKSGEIKLRKTGDYKFAIYKPPNSAKKPESPLDVEGVDLGMTAEEIVDIVREVRKR